MTVRTDPLIVDRSAAERDAPGIVEAAWDDPSTRVLVVRGDAAPLRFAEEAGLLLLPVADVPDGAIWAFLGRDAGGAPVLLAAFGAQAEILGEASWGAIREIGPALAESELELLVAAVSLGRWLVDSPFCPACGTALLAQQAGWSRRCPACGREHFPRTDPAVIVAIESPDGERLLLGANAAWQGRMYSCFAGFAEAGESLETTVAREIEEEAGVAVDRLRYIGSQAWPYPRSLMLGFRATAVDEGAARPDGAEILDVRWFTREEIGAGLAGRGDVTLPGSVSIAHRLIRSWYERA